MALASAIQFQLLHHSILLKIDLRHQDIPPDMQVCNDIQHLRAIEGLFYPMEIFIDHLLTIYGLIFYCHRGYTFVHLTRNSFNITHK